MDTDSEANINFKPQETDTSRKQNNEQNSYMFIVDSLNTLAQCAVGVFSVLGTIIIAVVGFGIDKKSLFLIIIANLIGFSADVFHRIFRIWSLPYVINLMLIDDSRLNCFALKTLICYLFDIENWEKTSKIIKEVMNPEEDMKFKENKKPIIGKDLINLLEERTKNEDASINLSMWPNHFGVLAILLCTNLVLLITFCIGSAYWR